MRSDQKLVLWITVTAAVLAILWAPLTGKEDVSMGYGPGYGSLLLHNGKLLDLSRLALELIAIGVIAFAWVKTTTGATQNADRPFGVKVPIFCLGVMVAFAVATYAIESDQIRAAKAASAATEAARRKYEWDHADPTSLLRQNPPPEFR